MLKEAIKNFRQPVRSKVNRSPKNYTRFKKQKINVINLLVVEYNKLSAGEMDGIEGVEYRTSITNELRRYQAYAIEENFGAHYVEQGLDPKDKKNGKFEHIIPIASAIEFFIQNKISTEQFLELPTCRLRKDNDILLTENGWSKKTPDIYNFWKRYNYCFNTQGVFTTWDGQPVDTNMTLDDHFAQFVVDTV